MPITKLDDPSVILRPKIDTLDLLVGYCPNEHLHIFGFWQQLKPDEMCVNTKTMKVTLSQECRECGCEVNQDYPLYWDHSGLANGAGI